MNCIKQAVTKKINIRFSVSIAAILLLTFFHTLAEGGESSSSPPTRLKKFHINYDVRPDASYTETDDIEISILTEQGAQMAKQMPAGRPNFSMNMMKMDVVILSAYTQKKDGTRIDAAQVKPQGVPGAPFGGAAVPSGLPRFPMLAFQNVEVGDTLVLLVKSIQNQPNVPNAFTIEERFPRYVANDDAVITLTAPTTLNLRVESKNMANAEKTSSGSTLKWIWRFQNLHPEKFQPNLPVSSESTPQIRISTYEDIHAEGDAYRVARMQPLLQIPVKELCMAKPWEANDGPAAGDQLAESINFYFWNMEDMLDRSVTAWNTPACVFDDGRPKLSVLNWGYDYVFSKQPDWSKSLDRIEYLKKKFPNKHFVALAEAKYWIEYAWNARGNGYASSVTPEGWRLFHERMQKAERILNETKSYSAEIPTWYVEMIDVQSALGRSEEERDKTFLEGARRYKTFYPTYFSMLHYLTPKWGGSWETVDNLVGWAVDNTKEMSGSTMYARLYWVVSGELLEGESLFKDTRASWPKMKRGFEDLMAKHPKSNWNLNNYAKFACEAGDKKTFLALRRKMGKNVMAAAWRGSSNLDLCESKFAYAE